MKRTRKAAEIGAAEAESILGVSRSLLHSLIRREQLSARVEDKGRRCYVMKRADVLALNERTDWRRKPKTRSGRHLLWQRYFGAVPNGFVPAFRDGDRRNVAPENLCLLPKRQRWSIFASGQQRKRKPGRHAAWTAQMIETLRAKYPTAVNEDLANELGMSRSVMLRRARKLKLRKDAKAVASNVSRTIALPVGTERPHHTGNILVKVSDEGNYSYRKQWRFKHHIAWEAANGRPVPASYRIAFRDGNKRNFDPSNLVALSRNEASALENIRFHSCPQEVKDMTRFATRMRRESNRQLYGGPAKPANDKPSNKGGAKPGERRERWTAEMDEILIRDYPHKLRAEVAAAIGVTPLAVRLRAEKRLGLRRLPETIMAEARAKAAAKTAQQAAA